MSVLPIKKGKFHKYVFFSPFLFNLNSEDIIKEYRYDFKRKQQATYFLWHADDAVIFAEKATRYNVE